MLEQSSRTYIGIFAILLLVAVSISITSHQAFAAASTGVIIPLYTYPTDGTFDNVIQVKNAHPSVPIIAVINPSDGPGSSIDSNYVTGIQHLQSAGITVLGYVATGYGSKSTSTLESQINSYNNWYHVNGIMFDEMANTDGFQSYYSTLTSYVKSHGMAMTVGNPGTDTLSSYVGTVDNMCIYENPGLPSISVLGGWHTSYPKSNWSMIAFGASLPSQSFITSVSQNVSYVYFTNDNLPNPYDTIPSYLGNLVAMLDTGSSPTTPQPPTSLTATAISSSQINLTWVASNDGGTAITGYKIERSADGGSTWSTIVSSTGSTSTSYSNTGLAASTTFTYRVSAINSVGTSAPSNTAFATTSSVTVATAPQPPTGLTATAISSSQINLSWATPSNNGGSAITGYEIERSTNNGSTWSTIVANTGSTATTYSNTGLTSSTTYTYRISAINSVGTSSPSNTASATTLTGASTNAIVLNGMQTTSTSVSSSPYQITFSNFNVGTGNDRVLIVGLEANNQIASSITFGGVQLTRAVSSFHNNDAEFWFLKNPTGTGNIVVTMSGPTSVVVGAYSFFGVDQTNPIPTTATNYNTASSSPTVSISTVNSNSWVIDSPSIYGGITLGTPTCTQEWDINMAGAITGASSSTIKASAGPVTCSWAASGSGDLWDDVAIEVKSSATTSAATAPQPPTGLTATAISSSQINLSWATPSNNGGSAITGYEIERSTNNGSTWSTIVANTGSTATTYSNTGLTSSTTYTYRISAINSVGTSSPSNTASATTHPNTVTITVKSVNLSGVAFSGMWTELHASNGNTLATGYTPIPFNVSYGVQYTVYVANYQNYVFSHWGNGSTNPSRTITPTQNIVLTAYYSTG